MRVLSASFSAALLTCAVPAANAQDGVDLGADYLMDVMTVADDRPARLYWLNNLDVIADLDLDRLAGWGGAMMHVDVLVNMGRAPNDRAGTLQGVDNVEVANHRLRLFEAWIEQNFGARTTLRTGLYDLNSEFYATDASGLLIGSAFGIGSEVAANGPNGPSVFPSTSLTARLDHEFGGGGFVRAAVLNAAAGTLGEPRGLDIRFDNGALLIAEAGVAGQSGKIGIGGWSYTERQDDVLARDTAGNPIKSRARGAYLVAERPFNDHEGSRAAAGFLRIGVSDGKTTPFRGGWQAGVLLTKLWKGRADSQFSIGLNQGLISGSYRQVLRGDGQRSAAAESAIEFTYSDKIGPLTFQPDFQIALDAGGDADAQTVFIAGLRISLSI